jgi:hypothetical protein
MDELVAEYEGHERVSMVLSELFLDAAYGMKKGLIKARGRLGAPETSLGIDYPDDIRRGISDVRKMMKAYKKMPGHDCGVLRKLSEFRKDLERRFWEQGGELMEEERRGRIVPG